MNRKQSGQILLITLLVLSVLTTVALALVSRSSTDVNISTQIEESNRAFSLAEAGIEEALRMNLETSATITLPSNQTVEVMTTEIDAGDGTVFEFLAQTKFSESEVATFWLVPHFEGNPVLNGANYDGSNLVFCFQSTIPAAIVSLTYIDSDTGEYRVGRIALTKDNTNFSSFTYIDDGMSDGCSPNTNYQYSVNLNLTWGIVAGDTPIFVRIRPLNNDGYIAVGVDAGATIYEQGYQYVSCGQAGYDLEPADPPEPTPTGMTNIEQCVLVYQLFKAPDAVFDYVLYTDGSL